MQAKLTEATAAEIIDRLARGERVVDLAREYHVSKTLIIFLKRGRIWKQVPRPEGKRQLEIGPHKRMSPREVETVLELLAEGQMTQKAIAEQMGVSESMNSLVKRRHGLTMQSKRRPKKYQPA